MCTVKAMPRHKLCLEPGHKDTPAVTDGHQKTCPLCGGERLEFQGLDPGLDDLTDRATTDWPKPVWRDEHGKACPEPFYPPLAVADETHTWTDGAHSIPPARRAFLDHFSTSTADQKVFRTEGKTWLREGSVVDNRTVTLPVLLQVRCVDCHDPVGVVGVPPGGAVLVSAAFRCPCGHTTAWTTNA